jgi:peptide/nickel transport system substrate-binding protein
VVIDNLHNKNFRPHSRAGDEPIYTLENIFKTGEDVTPAAIPIPRWMRCSRPACWKRTAKAGKIYQQIALQLYEDQPYTWLFYQSSFYGFNKSLRGSKFSPRGPYHYGPGFDSIWKPAAL